MGAPDLGGRWPGHSGRPACQGDHLRTRGRRQRARQHRPGSTCRWSPPGCGFLVRGVSGRFDLGRARYRCSEGAVAPLGALRRRTHPFRQDPCCIRPVRHAESSCAAAHRLLSVTRFGGGLGVTTFDPAAFTRFEYTSFAVQAATGTISCAYRLTGPTETIDFRERFVLGPVTAEVWGGARGAALRRIARLLWLAAGLSYFKTAAPAIVAV